MNIIASLILLGLVLPVTSTVAASKEVIERVKARNTKSMQDSYSYTNIDGAHESTIPEIKFDFVDENSEKTDTGKKRTKSITKTTTTQSPILLDSTNRPQAYSNVTKGNTKRNFIDIESLIDDNHPSGFNLDKVKLQSDDISNSLRLYLKIKQIFGKDFKSDNKENVSSETRSMNKTKQSKWKDIDSIDQIYISNKNSKQLAEAREEALAIFENKCQAILVTLESLGASKETLQKLKIYNPPINTH